MSKLKIISHRGNTNGPDPKTENHPDQIEKVIKETNYDIEIDVRYENSKFVLGHDKGQYEIPTEFFYNKKGRLWIHCKNVAALHNLLGNSYKIFAHDRDECVIIMDKYLWTFPDREIPLTNWSIAVLPERVHNWPDLENCYGVCTDYPGNY
jgi:hypothetical protein